MINFDYIRVSSTRAAVDAVTRDKGAQWIAGGTNLVDLMKKGVMHPAKLVDINQLGLKEIKKEGNNYHIGALALNSKVAADELIKKELPLLSLALNAGASQQLRNMATVG